MHENEGTPPRVLAQRGCEGTGKGRLTYYHLGATTIFASRADPRFAWCAYVPRDYDEDGTKRYPLTVVLHGTERDVMGYRDQFATWAEAVGSIVVSPLFPTGLFGSEDLENHKWIKYQGLRFDHLLLGIVDELQDLYRIESEKFLLHGFSGGEHFAHRFFYLHPERLHAVSVGAPSLVTLLDPSRPWRVGTGGIESQFGTPVSIEKLRRVPVQLVVGDRDTDRWEITVAPGDAWWIPGINDAGATRIERIPVLAENYRAHGLDVRLDLGEGAEHDGFALLESVKSFFAHAVNTLTQPWPSTPQGTANREPEAIHNNV